MRALVTGPHGFIARHLLARIPDDWEVHTSRGDLAARLTAPPVDVVFSLAAHVDVADSLADPRTTVANNVGIAQSVVEYAARCDAHVIHVTTAEVFGPGGPFGLVEPARPTNPYAASKAAQDAIFHAAAMAGLQVTMARTANVFGEHQPSGKFVPTVVRCLRAGDPVRLFGVAKRRWIHADDVADALIALAVNPCPANITGQVLTENADIVHHLAHLLKVHPTIELVEEVRPGHEPVYDLEPVNMPTPDDLLGGLRRMVTAC